MKRSWAVAMVVFLAGVPVAITLPAVAAPGDLDTTFSDDGKVTTDFTSAEDTAYGVAIQDDGKIVVAGTTRYRRFALARYNTDGSPDTTFSGDGKVTTDFTPRGDAAYAVAIQADGKIMAAGYAQFHGDLKFALARYTTDGSLDTTFSGDGKVTTDFTSGADGAYGVAIQDDGKIVAVGGAGGHELAPQTFALARYRPNGRLDTTFSGDGKVRTNFWRGGGDSAYAVAIQEDGKIVAAGGDSRFALARYRPGGGLDATFGGDGKVSTSIRTICCGSDAGVFAVAIQPDGKIVAAGVAALCCFALARYNSNGSLDTTFDDDGKVTSEESFGGFAYGVAVQADGKIVAAGMANFWDSWALARYNTDGTLDTTFGVDGLVTTDFSYASGADGAYGVAVQADGNIVAAGAAGGSGGRFAVARYLAA